MRILITGATGFVGSLLIPDLERAGHELFLVGQSRRRLTDLFGHRYQFFTYDELRSISEINAVIHLATKNNTSDGNIEEFRKANVDCLRQVAEFAGERNAKYFFYTASVHSEHANKSPYAVSKREAEELLNKEFLDLNVTTLVLPAVYADDQFAGNLAILEKCPKDLKKLAIGFLSIFRPVVHVEVLAKKIDKVLGGYETDKRVYLSDRQLKNLFYRFFSRAIDLSFAVSVLLLFWWLLVLVWLIIRFTSPGPGLFAQERVGKHGDKFVCYKFRTMKQGTKIAGTHEVSSDSVTAIGKVIRKLKIDELPQVWNMLRGHMSLVGPRPCLPVQQELIEERRKRGVLDVRCGLTGLSQINDIDMSDPVRLAKADAKYLALRTLPLDLKIIFRTFFGAGRSDRVKVGNSR